jgi:hypothetical protein
MSALLVRRPLREVESLRGYAMRMAHANECQDLIHPFIRSVGTATEALPALAALTTVNQAVLATRLSLDDRCGPDRRLGRVGDATIGSRTVRWSQRVICPACVERGVFSSVLWELAVVPSCDVHRLDLVGECPQCGASLDWQHGRINACLCGVKLSRFSARAARPGAVALCRRIRADVMSCVQSATVVDEIAVALDRVLLFTDYARQLLEPTGGAMLASEPEPCFSDQTCDEIATALSDPAVRRLLAGRPVEPTARLRLGRDFLAERQLAELNSLFAGAAPPQHLFTSEHLAARRQRWRSFAPTLIGIEEEAPVVS